MFPYLQIPPPGVGLVTHANKLLELIRESWAGIEPAHVGFADRSVTTSPPGQNMMHLRATKV